ncbi:MAG TPA: GNAT family N-acetyltransferase [Bacteroidota bacterium]|nr:GNAT family N-acetyltransferase [Bacteroidota bacterium]
MSTICRRWKQSDLEIVRYLLWETWKETYSKFIPPEDMEAYFAEHYTSDQMKELFKDRNVTGFVAETDEIIAGFEKLYFDEEKKRLYVHQLYTLPVYQGMGIGTQLLGLAAEHATAHGFDEVWLGVMVPNQQSVVWYKKFGYAIAETLPFTMGKTVVEHYIGSISVNNILAAQRASTE